MLVLTRRKDQRIVIGDDVVITVLDIRGDTVRIGIDAPRTVQVHREEVHEALVQANREAVLADPGGTAPAELPQPLRTGRRAAPRPGPLRSRPPSGPPQL